MICLDVMWPPSSQDPTSTSSSTASGSSPDNKRPLNCSAETSKAFSSDSPPSVSTEKRVKALVICPPHRTTLGKSNKTLQEIINKWQLSNFTKCIYDNAVNAVLDSTSGGTDSIFRENVIAGSAHMPHDFTLENEAVLMAIERKGLKQQNSPDYTAKNIFDSRNRSFSSKINCFYSSADNHQHTFENNAVETHQYLLTNDENQESNFENNFMTTAVSAAIEEKGLSMYHV